MKNTNTRLTMARAERDVTQIEVAQQALGLQSDKRYWQIENGLAKATPDERAKLAAYFGKSEAWLFGRRKTAKAA